MTFTKKIFTHPKSERTMQTVLHQTLEKLEHMEGVTVILHWKDGSSDVDHSDMNTSKLCMAALALHNYATGAITK